MLSANPYASRYQPVHDMRMSAAKTYASTAPEGGSGMPQGWQNMFAGTPLNGVPARQAPSAAGYSAENRDPPGYIGGYYGDDGNWVQGSPGVRTDGGTGDGYTGRGVNVDPNSIKPGSVPQDLGNMRNMLQSYYMDRLAAGEGGRWDPLFSREDLTLSMDPSWGTLNNTLYGALNRGREVTDRGIGYLDQLMQRTPRADYSSLSPFYNGAVDAQNLLVRMAQSGGGWNQGYADSVAGGPGMQALMRAAGNPSAVDPSMFAGASNGVGMNALRQMALTGGRSDITPQLDAIKNQGMLALDEQLAQIREQYGALGLGAGSDVSTALAKGASFGIADIVRQQSELAASLDQAAQGRILQAGGTEQGAMANLLASLGQLNLGSSGQAIQAGSGIQDSFANLLSSYIGAQGQGASAASALGNLGSNMTGTYGNLQLGNAQLQANTQLGAAQGMTGAGSNVARDAAALSPGLALYPQEKSRMDEANLQRWYQETLRQAQGPPILQQMLGYATNFPPVVQQQGSGWPGAIGAIGGGLMSALPWLLMSDRNVKEDITPAEGTLDKLKRLPIYTWKYIGDNVKHIGPMAQDFKATFGVGDGKTIFIPDMMSVMLASMKELANA